jgi:methylmalonyl-CoA/ethylmalonyl-CoA epimerase
MDVLAIDRVIIATDDADEARERYETLLGFSFGEPEPAETGGEFAVTYSHPGIEFLEPTSEDSPIADYLEANGQGVYGLVYRVADLDEAVSELAEHGVEPFQEGGPDDSPEAFYHPSDFAGVLTILTEYPHPIDW